VDRGIVENVLVVGSRWENSAFKSSMNSLIKYQPMDRKKNSTERKIKSTVLLEPKLKRRRTKNLTKRRMKKNMFPLNQI
jgi:hypothetical protein